MDIQDNKDIIHGGYIMIPRFWDESAISIAPAHTREIYFLFLRLANHKNVVAGGRQFKRGDLLITYDKISDKLKWSVGYRQKAYSHSQIESSLKWLTKHNLITKMKTTRGLIITICDYDYWQTPANYESHNENYTNATGEPQCTATINKNDKNDKNEKKKEVYTGSCKKELHEINNIGLFKSCKNDIIKAIEQKYPNKDACVCYDNFVDKMEIHHYKYDDYLTALYNWIDNDKYDNFPDKKRAAYIPDERDMW